MWLLYVAAAGTSAAGGLQRPPLDAMLPRLVPRDELHAASAIDGFVGNIGQIGAPALAGVLIATAGLSATYAIDAATFLASLIALSRMRAVPPPPDAAPPSLERIREGWRYARSRQDLMGTYAVDINAMLFGIPIALFPAAAEQYGGPEVLGLLYAAGPVGGVLLTLSSGWVGRVGRHGRAIAYSAGAYGLAIIALRPRRVAPARAARARRRGRGGHVLRDLPRDDVEPDDPRRDARPDGGDRAALLLDRADARHDALRPRRRGSRA